MSINQMTKSVIDKSTLLRLIVGMIKALDLETEVFKVLVKDGRNLKDLPSLIKI